MSSVYHPESRVTVAQIKELRDILAKIGKEAQNLKTSGFWHCLDNVLANLAETTHLISRQHFEQCHEELKAELGRAEAYKKHGTSFVPLVGRPDSHVFKILWSPSLWSLLSEIEALLDESLADPDSIQIPDGYDYVKHILGTEQVWEVSHEAAPGLRRNVLYNLRCARRAPVSPPPRAIPSSTSQEISEHHAVDAARHLLTLGDLAKVKVDLGVIDRSQYRMLYDAAAINVKIAKENKATTKIAEFETLEKAIASFNPEISVRLPERSWLDLRFEDFLYCLIELWIHGLHVVDGQRFPPISKKTASWRHIYGSIWSTSFSAYHFELDQAEKGEHLASIPASALRILKKVNGATWNHPHNEAFRFRAIDLLNASRVGGKKITVGEINALLDSLQQARH